MSLKFKKMNLRQAALLVLLVAAFAALIPTVDARGRFLTTSDDASELVLGRLLARENRVVTTSWFYSTEIRFLNTNLVYPLLFHFTDDFQTVRTLGGVILRLILLASYFALCRAFKIRRFAVATAILLTLPFSGEYAGLYFVFPYYIPHTVLAFALFSLLETFLQTGGRKSAFRFALDALFAFLVGFCGPRVIFCVLMPLFLAALFCLSREIVAQKGAAFFRLDFGEIKSGFAECGEDARRRFCWTFAALFASCAGYGFYLVLVKKGILHSGTTFFRFVDFDIGSVGRTLNGFLRSFGFTPGKFVHGAFSAAAAFLWISLTVASIIVGLRGGGATQRNMAIFRDL